MFDISYLYYKKRWGGSLSVGRNGGWLIVRIESDTFHNDAWCAAGSLCKTVKFQGREIKKIINLQLAWRLTVAARIVVNRPEKRRVVSLYDNQILNMEALNHCLSTLFCELFSNQTEIITNCLTYEGKIQKSKKIFISTKIIELQFLSNCIYTK